MCEWIIQDYDLMSFSRCRFFLCLVHTFNLVFIVNVATPCAGHCFQFFELRYRFTLVQQKDLLLIDD